MHCPRRSSIRRGRATCELLDGPAVCLAAIPLAATTTAATVLADLAAGTSFADVAKKYSSDPNLAATGGLIQDQNGTGCLTPSGFNADLITQIKAANAAPGKPVSISLNSVNAIVMIRLFDDLSQNDKAVFVQSELGAKVKDQLATTKVFVNPQYGKWDPTTVAVVALEQS